jgi:S-adenosyl-L-methionine hydrolase (adenosine-forming)
MSGIITLLTDFSTIDGYVGAMKGSILSIAPEAVLVDISHDIPPQDIRIGAFTLMTSTGTFPSHTVHLAVVDPGVGGARRALAIQADGSYFVGPDNGLLSWALASRIGLSVDAEQLDLPSSVSAISLDVRRYWRSTVSSTFHGRDIFGPVAAHLSRGEPLERVGTRVSSITALPFPDPRVHDGMIIGEVLVVDHYGNCISNIRGERLAGDLSFEIAGKTIQGLSANYESSESLLALIGSSEFLEIAAPGSSAANLLGVRAGAEIVVLSRRP